MAVAEDLEQEACAIIGRMILAASLLDNQLDRILVAVLSLEPSPYLVPVIATLDSSRKIEILKAHAKHLSSGEWKKQLLRQVESVEKVAKARNIVAHSVLEYRDGDFVLSSNAATKILKALDRNNLTIDRTKIGFIRDSYEAARAAFTNGETVLANFDRASAEIRKHRHAKRATSEER